MLFKSKIFVAAFGIMAMSILGMACGDSDEDSDGANTSFTSFDDKSELGSLSADDAVTLCKDSQKYIEASISIAHEIQCNALGKLQARGSAPENDEALQNACKTARDTCLEEDAPDTDATGADPDETCKTFEYPNSCTATVAEYVACQKANAAQMQAQIDSLPTCEELTLESVNKDPEEPATPAACVLFIEKCPGVFF